MLESARRGRRLARNWRAPDPVGCLNVRGQDRREIYVEMRRIAEALINRYALPRLPE
jgi:hypothetical protein